MIRMSDTNKIDKLIDKHNETNARVLTNYKVYDIKSDVINFKKPNEIIIADALLLNKDNDVEDFHLIKYRFNYLEESWFPFIHPKIYFYSNENVNYDILSVSSQYRQYWKYIANNVYEFQIHFYMLLRDEDFVSYDVYCNASLIILNERICHDIQIIK